MRIILLAVPRLRCIWGLHIGSDPSLLHLVLQEVDAPPFGSAEEDALARAAFDRLKAETETEESVPLSLVRRIHEGESPVKVWRQHRGLTQSALDEAVGLKQGSLSDLERGRSTASFDTYCRLADALGIELGDLRPPAE